MKNTILSLGFRGLLFSLMLSTASSVWAMSAYELVYRFTVKINNRNADVFTGRRMDSHGTGFFVGVREDDRGRKWGVIFTNRHVVEKSEPTAQSLIAEFTTDTDIPEGVSVKPVYISPVNDFAVLEFDLLDMKRAQSRILPAKLPAPNSPLYNFRENFRSIQGRPVLAFGNPMDATNHATEGTISGITIDPHSGIFIGTSAAINPGNSGGPLIDLETFEVIGINTAKIEDADNMGFATPIGVVIEEYQAWLKNPELARRKEIDILLSRIPESALKSLGTSSLVNQVAPRFFEKYPEVLRVEDAATETGLHTGDLIVKVNGKLMPPSQYEWRRHVQQAKSHLDVEIVRSKKILKVKVPVRDSSYHELRSRVDFVSVSGLVFTNISRQERWFTDHNLASTAQFNLTMPNPELNFGAMRMPDMGSVLININVGGKDYPIHDVADLRRVLRQHSGERFARFDFREPVLIFNEDEGTQIAVRTPFGTRILSPWVRTYVIPIIDVLTPHELSLSKFIKGYSFDQDRPETRNLRAAIKPKTCAEALTSSASAENSKPTAENPPAKRARPRRTR